VVIWNITPCSASKFIPRFGGTCRLHPQDRAINPAGNEHEADTNHLFTENGLYGVIYLKTGRHRNFPPCCIQRHFNPVSTVSRIFVCDYAFVCITMAVPSRRIF
jgi:hypothetical protein